MKYEEIKVGQTAEMMHRVVSRDILDFMMLSGDKNELHTDMKFAQSKGFDGPVAYGMLMGAYISAVMGTQLPGNGCLWKTQSFRFIKPVYLGDMVTIKVEVKSKHDMDRSITLITDVLNEKNEEVVCGIATVKMLE